MVQIPHTCNTMHAVNNNEEVKNEPYLPGPITKAYTHGSIDSQPLNAARIIPPRILDQSNTFLSYTTLDAKQEASHIPAYTCLPYARALT